MEVKEALKWFEWADDVYYCSMPNASPNNEFYKQSKEIKNLLKSLASENKKLKKENEAYKAYKGIVEEIENDFGNGILQNENGFGVKLEHLIEIKKQKFFGGGK